MRLAACRRGLAAAAIVAAAAAPLGAQPNPATDRKDFPRWRDGAFDGEYPVRLLTLETGRVLAGGDGIVGLGDTRYALLDRRLEIVTNTISDLVGIANVGVKLGVRAPRGGEPGLAIGAKLYQSYPGLIDEGVKRIAESFSTITDSEVEVSGWVGYATATWIPGGGVTGTHVGFQLHQPFETSFEVFDAEKGGGGRVTFDEGEDLSFVWGLDHQLIGTRLVALAEAGWSFGLDRARFGVGADAGSQHWRVALGVTYPGVETDLATEPRDFVVNPALSFHYRF